MKNLFLTCYAFLRRDFLLDSSYKLQFIISLLSIFFSVYIFFFFSKLFEDNTNILSEYNNDYFFFLITGICITDLVFRISITMNMEIRNYQLTGVFEELINVPTNIIHLLMYSHVYPFIMSLFRIFIYFFVAINFFGLDIYLNNLEIIAIVLFLLFISYLGISMIAGAYAITFKKGNPISSINRLATITIGGVFFPATLFPDWLANISNLLPITHSLEIIRSVLSPVAVGTDEISQEIIILTIISVSLASIGYILCRLALIEGKKRGTLTLY